MIRNSKVLEYLSMTRPDRPLISVVFSFRNEAENIPTLVARLDAMFAGQNVDYEIVFVNDSSTDASLSTARRGASAQSAHHDREYVEAVRRGGGCHCRHGHVSWRRCGLHGCRPAGSA